MDFMTILLAVVMLAALGGMIYCNKKQDTFPAAKAVAVLLMLVVVGCGGYLIVNMSGSGDYENLRKNENKFYVSQAHVIGDFIKTDMGGGKIVIIADENFEKDERIPDFVAAMKSASGSDAVEVVTLDLPKDANSDMMPLMERMKAADFNKVTKAHADAKVIVSQIGLPRDVKKLDIIKNAVKGKGPALVLMGYSEVPGLAGAVQVGAVAGVVTVSPKAVFDEKPAPKDPKEAFAVRYVLVTKKNVAEHGKLLGR